MTMTAASIITYSCPITTTHHKRLKRTIYIIVKIYNLEKIYKQQYYIICVNIAYMVYYMIHIMMFSTYTKLCAISCHTVPHLLRLMSSLQPLPCGSHGLRRLWYGPCAPHSPTHHDNNMMIIAIDVSLKGSNVEVLDTALPVNLIECYDDDD